MVFFLILLCCSEIASGQSIKLSYKGSDVTNREVYVVGESNEEVLKAGFVITNLAQKAVQVKVRKIENTTMTGTQNSFCLGVCYAPSVFESIFPYTVSAGQSTNDTVFSVEFCPCGLTGKWVIKYEVFDIADVVNNKVSVTANFINSPDAGSDRKIDTKTFLTVYPNPCTLDRITFNYSELYNDLNGTIIIMNSLGVVTDFFFLKDLPGNYSLNVRDYPAGIYFYSLMEKGKPVCTGKIIIEH